MTKKKKGQDPDGGDDGEQNRTPIRSELDKLESMFFYFCWLHADMLLWSFLIFTIQTWYLLNFFAEKEQTPLQEALNQLIRQLQRCSFNLGFFLFDLVVCLLFIKWMDGWVVVCPVYFIFMCMG